MPVCQKLVLSILDRVGVLAIYMTGGLTYFWGLKIYTLGIDWVKKSVTCWYLRGGGVARRSVMGSKESEILHPDKFQHRVFFFGFTI